VRIWIGLCLLGLLLAPGCTSDDGSPEADGGSADSGGADSSPALLGCQEATNAAVGAVLERSRPLAACTTDADCTSVDFTLRCPERDTQIVDCPLPVAKGREAEASRIITDVASELCGSFGPDCHSYGDCNAAIPCIDGTCKHVSYPTP